MNILEIIAKKRDGMALTDAEIRYFVGAYAAGRIPDYQAAALLMAIYLRDMSEDETFSLTAAMRDSGDIIDLSRITGVKVDKHSTGGVGDKTTLVAAPIAAACGVPIAKMSGRGLGFTGGTVDKLESIPGFRTELSEEEFFAQIEDIGISVIGQTAAVAKADKKLYALRDVTATVANRALISSSIMSKKLACGADAIVLDVKLGNGAFLKEEAEAEALAKTMIRIGEAVGGKRMAAVVSDMNQPLGRNVGNTLEVMEAVDTLKGHGPDDFTELCMTLAAAMIFVGGRAETYELAEKMANNALSDGAGLRKFTEMVERQGGNAAAAEDFSLLGTGRFKREVKADADGYIGGFDTEGIGKASQRAGAGRMKKDDEIDFGAGVTVERKLGDAVCAGDVVMTVYSNYESRLDDAASLAAAAYTVADRKPEVPPLVRRVYGIGRARK